MAADPTICIGTLLGKQGEACRSFYGNNVKILLAGGAMALELAMISVLAGAVLGLRYKVLILVPAVMFAMIFTLIVGVAHADGLWSIVLMMTAVGIAVQIGYVAGIVLRAAADWVFSSLNRDRGPELSCSLGPVWPHNAQLNGLPVQGAIGRIRQPPPPHV
jgi:hypothetical protein